MNPDQALKAQLARVLCEILDGWSQCEAAALVQVHQSELSRLRNNDLARFSVDRLIRLVAERGYDVRVELQPIPRWFANPRPRPAVSVVRLERKS